MTHSLSLWSWDVIALDLFGWSNGDVNGEGLGSPNFRFGV